VRPDLGGGDPTASFVFEVEEVVRCVNANQPSPILDCDLARDAIVLCHKQTESVKKGRLVKI
jgi:hypothetical protein